MNLSGFDRTKKLSDEIESSCEGTRFDSNKLRTPNVSQPLENDYLSDFNKGVDIMFNIGNHRISE